MEGFDMKKKYLFLSFLAIGGLFTSCSREHQCKCFYSDDPNDEQFKVFVVDGNELGYGLTINPYVKIIKRSTFSFI